jgi:hypothetical protein
VSADATAAPVVLCSAGISRNAHLPDGQGLARRVLEELWVRSWQFRGSWPRELDRALAWQPDRQPVLQLELVLELLGRHVDPRTLVGIFSYSAEPFRPATTSCWPPTRGLSSRRTRTC